MTESITRVEVLEAVKQARDYWSLNLTDGARRRAKGHWLPFLLNRIAELEAEVKRLRELVRRAMSDSTVTTDDGPGCFFCDHVECTPACEAAEAMR